MKKDHLQQTIKEIGLDEPTAEFSNRLTHHVINSYAYRQNLTIEPAKAGWIGRVTILVLVALNGLMLIKLNPFQAQPVLCYATGGFLLAFCCVLLWLKKQPILPL